MQGWMFGSGGTLLDGLVNFISVIGEKLVTFRCPVRGEGDIHFIEAVDEIMGAGTEFLFPFHDEHLADFSKQFLVGGQHPIFE